LQLFSQNKVQCQREYKDNQLFIYPKATKFEKRAFSYDFVCFFTFAKKLPQTAMPATFFEVVYLHGILTHIHLA
jgi:hypothetical protein